MNDEQQAPVVSSNQHRLGAIVRKHPLLSMLGVGGIALIGGTELAAGVLIGAGIDTMLRRRRTAESATETHESHEAAEIREAHEAHGLRDRSKALIDRVPHVVRERTRAVLDAARGKHPTEIQTAETPTPTPKPAPGP
jgi:hypothetical protein